MMKKVLGLLTLCCLSWTIAAQQVDVRTAQTVAENFLAQHQFQKSGNDLALYAVGTAETTQKSGEATVCYYIFKAANTGFVIVSGDQRITPVLAYSVSNSFDTTDMSDNLRGWLQNYRDEITYSIRSENEAETYAPLWKAYVENSLNELRKTTAEVSPLVVTQWNQRGPYNNLCPYNDSVGYRCPTGCLATAMAQILKFWNYPYRGVGSHSYTHKKYGLQSANFGSTIYDWNNMTNTYSSSSSDISRQAVSTLMYHCGVAVDMDYEYNGSGAFTLLSDEQINQMGLYDGRTALKRYFNCESVLGYARDNYYLDTWVTMLKNELSSGRPILYAGQGSGGGHAFVCDGFDSEGKFHINWGWGGSSDGYFVISALNPGSLGTGGGSGGYNSYQRALFVNPGINEKFQLFMYSALNVSSDTIAVNGPFSLTANVANTGSKYTGFITAGIYTSNGTFVTYMDSTALSLDSMYYGEVTISTQGLSALSDGEYYACFFYRSGNHWRLLNGGSYSNRVDFVVGKGKLTYDLAMYGDLHISSNPVRVNTEVTFTDSIVNHDTRAFDGKVAIAIFDEQTELQGVFGARSLQLSPNYYIPNLAFKLSAAENTLTPGNYFAAVVYRTDDEQMWRIMDEGYYTNWLPFKVSDGSDFDLKMYGNITISDTLIPYGSAFYTKVSVINKGTDAFVGNLAMCVFDGSGKLVDSIQVYRNINMASGYFLNNTRFSTSGLTSLQRGKTYYAKVCYYNTKTYQWTPVANGNYTNSRAFRVISGEAVDEAEAQRMQPYPTPTKGIVYLPLQGKKHTVKVLDMNGKLLSTQTSDAEILTLDLSGLSNGLYFIRTSDGDKTRTYKVIKQ